MDASTACSSRCSRRYVYSPSCCPAIVRNRDRAILQVALYVRTRTLDEVLLMVKEHQGASSTRMKAQEDWKGAAKKRADVTSEADLRCSAFTDVEVSHPRDSHMGWHVTP